MTPVPVRLLFTLQKRRFGQVLNASLEWSRIPKLYYAFVAFYAGIERKSSPLEPRLRSLVMTRIAQLCWCSFCEDLNASILLGRGASREDFDELCSWKISKRFSDKEKLALEYAEAMTSMDGGVSDELRGRVRKGFPEPALTELTAVIAYQNMSARFNQALAVLPQGFCKIEKGVE